MEAKEDSWRQPEVHRPTGQYDPTKLINWSINRWAFKPELGYSERWGNWVLDGYAGVWFYTQNPESFHIPFPVPQTQAPVGTFEGHFSYDFSNPIGRKMRGWFSLDGNFWWGGIASIYGIPNPNTRQTSSRLGGTISIPYTNHQSIKVAYSGGHVQPLRWRLSESAGGLAVLVDRESLVIEPSFEPPRTNQLKIIFDICSHCW